jgi:hypothetical protein
MRDSTKLQIKVIGAILSLMVIIVPIVAWLNEEVYTQRQALVVTGPLHPDTLPSTFSGIRVESSIKFMDTSRFVYKIFFEANWVGEYQSTDGLGLLTQPIELLINGKIIPLNPGQPTFPLELSPGFRSGLENSYPLDVYTDKIEIYARVPRNDSVAPARYVFTLVINFFTIQNKN